MNELLGTKAQKHIFTLGAATLLTLAAYIWFINTPYFDAFAAWSKSNLVLFFTILVVIKTAGIIWPPLPGGILTLGAIPIIGWPLALLADFVGSILGCSVAYYLGKKYGFEFLEKIFNKDVLAQVKAVKIKKHREIEAIFGLRVLTGSVLTEVLSYSCGLLKISYPNFLIGTVASHLVITGPIYFFAGSLFDGKRVLISMVSMGLAILLVTKFKGRYLE
jgi:uncharacterized membrane protein YdjX (TVP38/TMEM64 family)